MIFMQYATVTKAFEQDRTPCPIEGSVGKLLEVTGGWHRVEFNLPFQCTEDQIWLPSKDTKTMVIRFREDELLITTVEDFNASG